MDGSSSSQKEAPIPDVCSISTPPFEGIDILDLVIYILRAKGSIFWQTAFAMFVGLLIALLVKPVFTATAVIMPPQQDQSAASAMMGQLGSLGGLGSVAGVGLKNPSDMYVGMLQSRVIADELINRFHLQAAYKQSLRTGARDVLRRSSDFEAAKDGLIYVRVKDSNPRQAAALANAYVESLHELNSRLAMGQAGQRRMFYDQQIREERKALTAAEDDLKQTQERTGLIQLNGQTEMTIRNIASMRAQIASREVALGVTRTFATEQNPDVGRLQQEITSLRGQLALLENAQARAVPGDVQVPSGRVPEAGLAYLRKLREVRYHESLFELLLKQREAASIDEAKSSPLIQVVDPAEPPERKSGPSRTFIILGFGFAGLLFSTLWAIVSSVLLSMRQVPEQAIRLEELQHAAKFRTN